MIICIDYDGTYTCDKKLWNKFIAITKKNNHKIYCLTMRYPEETISDIPCEVIYTSRNAKQPFSQSYFREKNLKPQSVIYIDDMPEFLLKDAI